MNMLHVTSRGLTVDKPRIVPRKENTIYIAYTVWLFLISTTHSCHLLSFAVTIALISQIISKLFTIHCYPSLTPVNLTKTAFFAY